MMPDKKTSNTKQYNDYDSFNAHWSNAYRTTEKTSHKRSKTNKKKQSGEKV